MGNILKRLGYGTWETPGAEGVQEAAGTQSGRMYIEQRQATVAQWVALRPLSEVFAREIEYEGERRRRKLWWRQEATKKNFRPPWKTRGKTKGEGAVGRRACSRTSNIRERKYRWVIGMLGQRRAMPRWVNDLVWQSQMLVRRQGKAQMGR